ncbi:uncharacterized protein LY79DRAFT_560595 [Colletotrichum navitas]|uniref:Uncharacterized protein n=1 Tax=Colletotrichum navitas TaxID=681940 RepID=A0AAD8PUE0_9PEZI|nr:uncharacterized protein LY79DRAFT_560595 [Colletotrichum navitas]KAK1584801.1 hypothetical protein LY79DRAFT_560595 [Colletotrichum navitas]
MQQDNSDDDWRRRRRREGEDVDFTAFVERRDESDEYRRYCRRLRESNSNDEYRRYCRRRDEAETDFSASLSTGEEGQLRGAY